MLTSNFNYHLPKNLIATHGKQDRSTSKLMCINKTTNKIQHKQFKNLPELLTQIFPEKCSLVVNNTMVMKARLYAHKPSGKRIEILLLRHQGGNSFSAMIRGRVPINTTLNLKTATVKVVERNEDATVILEFDANPFQIMTDEGHTPLPPYIQRNDTEEDATAYQTIFAQKLKLGSVASSTASIHFNQQLLEQLDNAGITLHEITLHIGLGTFKPITTDTIDEYKIHSEYYEISNETAQAINKDKAEGKKIVCVGSTSVRALESNAAMNLNNNNAHSITPYAGETNLYITPGFNFQVADAIVTNFHMPKTTLLVMMSAFYNREKLLEAYQEGVEKGYQFYSYGDAMIMY